MTLKLADAASGRAHVISEARGSPYPHSTGEPLRDVCGSLATTSG